jgi:LmbE family N-acetylglucosaminyl deacetylase
MVFSPHQDDETLGCGGTMMLKRSAGVQVTCVFMTDGSASHKHFMGEDDLRRLRRKEAMNAAAVLGLSKEDVHFMDFTDGRLKQFQGAAVAEAVTLVDRYRPEEVYVPYRADGTPDHADTYSVVAEAVKKTGRKVELCEYPIWFWNQWPWVPMRLRCNRDTGRALSRMLWAGLGLRMLTEFRSGVFVGDLLERKRRALDQYSSQMTVLQPGTNWPTLGDLADGEFLKCFFQEFEIFAIRTVTA